MHVKMLEYEKKYPFYVIFFDEPDTPFWRLSAPPSNCGTFWD